MVPGSRKILLSMLLLFMMANCFAQHQNLEDSLRDVIRQNRKDTNGVNALAILGWRINNADSVLLCGRQAQELSHVLMYKRGEANSLLVISKSLFGAGDISSSIQTDLEALHIYERINDNTGIASVHLMLQGIYRDGIKDYRSSLKYALYGEEIAEKNNIIGFVTFFGHRLAPGFLAEIGQTYILMNMPDSALYYTKKAISFNELFNGYSWAFPYYLLATIQNMKGNYQSALENFRLSKTLTIQNDILRDTIQINSGISTVFKNLGELDSALYYANSVLKSWNYMNSEPKNLLEALGNMGEVYKLQGEKDSAIKYIELVHAKRDSLYNEDNNKEVQNMAFNEQLKQQELATAQANFKSKLQKLVLAVGLMGLLLVAGLLWRNNRQKQKSYTILESQKRQTELEREKAEQALEKLQSAQKQLIQAEKMASLGELTAGIAHEIQNPLNFVNNFSEVNTELIEEMKKEIDQANLSVIKKLANDLDANMEKITMHGKRADAIVKNMLQHSRTGGGLKEPTDINALAEEYLRLSFHGLRAKDKTFNAAMRTDFDENIGVVNIIPQDIGRVLLNIYNNAFYAVAEKKATQPEGYEPLVTVTTKLQVGGEKESEIRNPPLSAGQAQSAISRQERDKLHQQSIVITIEDNGNGIPKNVLDKIFQPFFTTKPTGEGTGLGLSLSYDIIKVHGGELKVVTKEGEGASFTIELPHPENGIH
jgi:two-component system, NtrC family, sensor kinase